MSLNTVGSREICDALCTVSNGRARPARPLDFLFAGTALDLKLRVSCPETQASVSRDELFLRFCGSLPAPGLRPAGWSD